MNNRQQFERLKSAGLTTQTAEERVKLLVSMLLDALFIPVEHESALIKADPKRLEYFGINQNEPINFGDLKCVGVEEKNGVFEVTVDEAAPNECPSLCEYIERHMAFYGWPVEVFTEW